MKYSNSNGKIKINTSGKNGNGSMDKFIFAPSKPKRGKKRGKQ